MSAILFLGQKPIGEHCFDILLGHCPPLSVRAVVSNESPGSVWWKSDGIHARSQEISIPFLDNGQRAEDRILNLIKTHTIDTIISVQHNWIISPDILNAVDGRGFNLHNAKLPDYKGYNACNHALLNGDTTFTATIHWMAPEVDAGPLAFEETFPIADDETAISLYRKAEKAGVRAFRRLAEALAGRGDIPQIPMQGEGTFYPRDSIKEQRRILDPSDREEMLLKARAFHFPPFESAYYLKDGEKRYVTPEGETA